MKSNIFNLSAYLQRIEAAPYENGSTINIDYIKYLMRCQLFRIPFENIDVQQGKIISLNPDDIFKKIIENKRGGYCYELNGLFAMALQSLGIRYQFVAARPMFYPVLRPKTHMALVVNFSGEYWLCDLGFGSYGIREPVSLQQLNEPISQDFDHFMLTKDNTGEYLLQALIDNKWTNQYAFNLSPQLWIDFSPANYLNSTHPEAIFVQKLLLIQHSETERMTLLGNTLKITDCTGVRIKEIQPDEQKYIVSEYFGLEI